jgi:hypothetical protein
MQIQLCYRKRIIDDNRQELLGFTYKHKKKILIKSGMSKQRLFEVLVHEFTHLSLVLAKIKLSESKHEQLAFGVGRIAVRALGKLK